MCGKHVERFWFARKSLLLLFFLFKFADRKFILLFPVCFFSFFFYFPKKQQALSYSNRNYGMYGSIICGDVGKLRLQVLMGDACCQGETHVDGPSGANEAVDISYLQIQSAGLKLHMAPILALAHTWTTQWKRRHTKLQIPLTTTWMCQKYAR